MKPDIHPEYQIADVHCSCGNTFQTRSTVSEIRAGELLELPPLLHGQAEARGHRWPRRALPAQGREDEAGPAGREGLTRSRASHPWPTRLPHPPRPRTSTAAKPSSKGDDARRRHWAVAVRRPAGDVHVESHHIESVADRHPILRKPGLRGVIVLGQSLAIGVRALMIAANQSVEDEEQLTKRQVGVSLAIAMIFFVAIFILGPTLAFTWVERRFGGGVLTLVLEGLFRVALFVGYLWLIGRTKDIHRVFEYHGAEHKTIAAFEHGDDLEATDLIDRYPKEHVRCGTNFLIIVMIITIFVFTLFGTPGIWWRLGARRRGHPDHRRHRL